MLDNISDFTAAVEPLMGENNPLRVAKLNGEMYCPSCQDVRRMEITPISQGQVVKYLWNQNVFGQGLNPATLNPSTFVLQCLQCETRFSVLLYMGPTGANIAIFPTSVGGLATQNTPKDVAFFLDQAYKAQAGGATTAAVLMYRAALEQLLTDQNYSKKNITDKIKDLEVDIQNGSGPTWVHNIDSEFLRVIKDLANEGIHVNSGDTSTLAALDERLLAELHIVFVDLLDEVYEKPIRKADKLKLLKQAHSQVKP
jgi:hypothetical protein